MNALTKYINIIARCTVKYRGDKFLGCGLAGHQITYILYVCASPGITQDKLAQELYKNKSNVCRQLASLEELGYIIRRECESDRRMTEVYPSEKALSELPQIKKTLREWNDYLLEEFSQEDSDKLSDMLSKIAARAKVYADGSLSQKD